MIVKGGVLQSLQQEENENSYFKQYNFKRSGFSLVQ